MNHRTVLASSVLLLGAIMGALALRLNRRADPGAKSIVSIAGTSLDGGRVYNERKTSSEVQGSEQAVRVESVDPNTTVVDQQVVAELVTNDRLIASVDVTPQSDGFHTSHHSNGAVAAHGEYRNFRKHGLWIEYSDTGTKLLEGQYQDDLVIGVWRAWYDNGSIRAEARCDAGRFEGQCTFWTKDGRVDEIQSGYYQNGKRIQSR